jgi:hypothetical protein
MSDILETFSMQNPEEGEQLNPDFRVKEENETFKFWYSKAKYGSKLGCTVFFFVFMISLLLFLRKMFFAHEQAEFIRHLITWLVTSVAVTYIIMFVKNLNRKDGEFQLSTE